MRALCVALFGEKGGQFWDDSGLQLTEVQKKEIKAKGDHYGDSIAWDKYLEEKKERSLAFRREIDLIADPKNF